VCSVLIVHICKHRTCALSTPSHPLSPATPPTLILNQVHVNNLTMIGIMYKHDSLLSTVLDTKSTTVARGSLSRSLVPSWRASTQKLQHGRRDNCRVDLHLNVLCQFLSFNMLSLVRSLSSAWIVATRYDLQ